MLTCERVGGGKRTEEGDNQVFAHIHAWNIPEDEYGSCHLAEWKVLNVVCEGVIGILGAWLYLPEDFNVGKICSSEEVFVPVREDGVEDSLVEDMVVTELSIGSAG